MIDQNTKQLIKSELNKFVSHTGSGAKAAVQLGISNATVSNVLNDAKESLISDDMWRKVAAVLGLKLDERWQHADTVPYLKLSAHLNDARLHGNCTGVICHPGSGKSYTTDTIAANYKNVIVVKCVECMTVKAFYGEILRSIGKKPESFNIYDILQQVVKTVLKLEAPIIIIDELERAKNRSIRSQIIDIYNLTEGQCGIAVLGTSVLKVMMDNDIKRQKPGGNTLFDRLNIKWIELTPPSEKDVLAVLKANGITDQNTAYSIANDCVTEDNQYTLRRVKRKVHAFKQKAVQ